MTEEVRACSFVILSIRLHSSFAGRAVVPRRREQRAHEKIANFLLAISGPMFILGKNCGAFANGNLSGALPEENPEQTPA